ncbi:adenosylmethionine decarboxylase [Parageobacillus toebii]|uniref:adenosylmethionine decarboxylase n=1 Tax=Parageobacillus toebii TaxID=153151 RepID=UPI0035B53B3C
MQQDIEGNDDSVNVEGKHVIIDAFECDSFLLDNMTYLEQLLTKAAQDADMEILYSYFHQFNPQGITGMLILSTSHISIHTWPEERYASLDFYTCGEQDPIDQVESLLKGLSSKRAMIYSISRGVTQPQLISSKEMTPFDSSKGDDSFK